MVIKNGWVWDAVMEKQFGDFKYGNDKEEEDWKVQFREEVKQRSKDEHPVIDFFSVRSVGDDKDNG